MPGIERKAFVLLSGGVDSTTCLYKAANEFPNIEGISIHYGQRHLKELEYAKKSCDAWSIVHTILTLNPDVLSGAMLTDERIEIPSVSYADLPHGVSPTYVPYRNGTLLSLVTAYAQKWVNKQQAPTPREAGIYFGAHAEDAHNWAYPDCTPEFIGAMANAIYVGTYKAVRLHTPVMWMQKYEIIQLGETLGVDWGLTWSCYKCEELHCGVCPTCRARQDAFRNADVEDPTVYQAMAA